MYAICRNHDKRLCVVGRAWDFFRVRFDQREDLSLGSTVAAADEVVWSCYAEAIRAAERLPPGSPLPVSAPLPYIEHEYAARALPRDEPPHEVHADGTDAILGDYLDVLPVPVVGLPDSCVTAPWWLSVIGHEVGHHLQPDLAAEWAVTADFGQLMRRTAGTDPVTGGAAAARWQGWQNGTINKANLDGTGVTTLITGQSSPFGVAVDSSHIYWANDGSGTIMVANLDGTGVTTLVTGQTSLTGVAVNSGHIYWVNSGTSGTINEANLDGTGVTTLVTGQSQPTGVAVDSSHIYWTNHGSGTIMAANLNGTGVTTLLTGQNLPAGVAVDSSHIYWTNDTSGTIKKANLNGTGLTTLVTGQSQPEEMAVWP